MFTGLEHIRHSFRMEQYFSHNVGDFAISLVRFLNLRLQSPPLQKVNIRMNKEL